MIGKTSALNLTNTFQSIINNPIDSQKTVEIVTLIISNITSQNAIIDVVVTRNDIDYSILKSSNLPANKSLSVFISKDFGIYLEPGDSLKLKADDELKTDAVCSYYLKNIEDTQTSNSSSSSENLVSNSSSSSQNSASVSSSSSSQITNGWDGTTYYINGEATTLDSCGNGTWGEITGACNPGQNCQRIPYVNGSQVSKGWSACANVYLLYDPIYNAVRSTNLNQNGNGLDEWGTGTPTYFIDGVPTNLGTDGTGCLNGVNYYLGNLGIDPTSGSSSASQYGSQYVFYSVCDSKFYVDAQATTLSSSGNGCWNNTNYYLGYPWSWFGVDPSFSGYNTCGGDNKYYINGQDTTLNQNGTGIWNDKYYKDGSLGTGWFPDHGYYINGDLNPGLDSCGTGYDGPSGAGYYLIDGMQSNPQGYGFSSCAGKWWIGYQLTDLPTSGTGYLDLGPTYSAINGYYIEGNQTGLDQNGSGEWNGNTYVGGVCQDC